ncbi:MAG: hypothetical protein BMS9Abin04_422 [Planctomycetia bacterium]|nr:MAG: hypothetical protein BMS9Abin04_422 [Planctomycetia bacterium]
MIVAVSVSESLTYTERWLLPSVRRTEFIPFVARFPTETE